MTTSASPLEATLVRAVMHDKEEQSVVEDDGKLARAHGGCLGTERR